MSKKRGNLNLVLFLTIILLFSLVLINITNAAIGVGYPFPSQLELKPGEAGRFQFEIQTTSEEGLVICSYNLETPIPLIVDFDEQSVSIPPTGQMIRMPVYATVTAPVDINPGSYSTSFCVSCKPAKLESPVGMLGSYCGITFGVDVVSERTRDNPYVPSKPFKLNLFVLGIVLISIIILIILTVYVIKRLSKKNVQ